MISLQLSSVSKSYGGRRVLDNVCCSVASGEVLGVLGSNGSGKSTLVKIIAGVVRPDAGEIRCSVSGDQLDSRTRRMSCGLVAPYLALYDEFSPREHLHLHASLHGTNCTEEQIAATLTLVQIDHRADEHIRTFSSGMKQRVALACASILEPPILLLDEPGSTLDEAGRTVCQSIVRQQQQRGGITILATNDEREVHLCTGTFYLSSQHSSAEH